jgi:hypothetical protein
LLALARCDDIQLRELAVQDLRNPSSPEDQLRLGDAWWNYAGDKINLPWRRSQERAASWYRKAVAKLDATSKGIVENRLKVFDGLPAGFQVLARRVVIHPGDDRQTASNVNLLLETRKKAVPGKGYSLAALALGGVRYLNVTLDASPKLKWVSRNSFAGFMIDYHTPAGYVKRVALSVAVFDQSRMDAAPRLGKNGLPDQYLDLGRHDLYELDLQRFAPQKWDGRIWFTLLLEHAGTDTYLIAQLMPVVQPPRP